MNADQITQIPTPPGAVSNQAKEAEPPVSPVAENLITPTHSEVAVPAPLQAHGVVSSPVAKLPDEHGMVPNPPNFESVGKINLPVGITDINAARALRNGSPKIGITWEATGAVRQEERLEEAA